MGQNLYGDEQENSDEKVPLLFDTDIGGDIDDALALLYLLGQPRCELAGITTVSGQAVNRAKLIDAVCRAVGRTDIPIHAGTPKSLLSKRTSAVDQKKVLQKYPHRKNFPSATAIEFLRETIRSRPGELTLLSVGPLTNIGLLFAIDPEIPSLLKRYVMMGGLYLTRPTGYGLREWNVIADPYASAITFNARPPETRCIGLDVTTRCTMSREDCHKRLNRGPLKVVADMAELWFERRPKITMHDPLAAMCVFEPNLCNWRAGRVEIELQSDELIGLSRFDPKTKQKPHLVAADVQPRKVFDHYFKTIDRLVD